MRPNHVIVLETMPTNLNGKIDKHALRDIFRARVHLSSTSTTDCNQLVDVMLQLWRSAVPGLEEKSYEHLRTQHIVALGASSIDVVECANKLCARLGA